MSYYKKLIDKIFNEISLRTYEGYPDWTNQQHIDILKEVLRDENIEEEYIIELLKNFKNKYKRKKVKKQLIKESKTNNIIEKIIKSLKSGKVFSVDILEKIFALVTRDEKEYNNLIEIINNSGIPNEYSTIIADKIYSYTPNEITTIINYMNNKTVKFSDLKTATNLTKLFAQTNINNDFLNWINNYKYSSSIAIGSGEIALAILIKNGTMKSTAGDVNIDGHNIEVKGSNNRIKGQHGYGTSDQASKHFSSKLKEWFKKYEKQKNIKNKTKIPKGGSKSYQLGKQSIKNNIFNKLVPILIKNKIIQKNDVINAYKEALQKVFYKMDVNWVSKHINNKGQIEKINSFIEDWFRAAVKYYFTIEGFDSLIILERSGKIKYLTANDDPVSKIKIKDIPSFTSRASRGVTFKIGIK